MLTDAYPSWQHRDGRARRAALREGLLRRGRLLGWPARTVIAFTEQLARRPWKRCTRAQLADVLAQLRAVVGPFEARRLTPQPVSIAQDRPRRRRAPGV